jgi:NO-binding membrane sensor protein with MHYT domain
MHYVGMLAYRMDMPVLYDWPTVLLSMLAAIAASCIALSLVARKSMSWWGTVTGGTAMGAAIASMHYIGMAAMRMPMAMTYSGSRVVLSVVAAIGISMIGLRLTFGAKEVASGWSVKKAGSTFAVGLAIPTMHYIGMAAARWSSGPGRFAPSDLQHAISVTTLSTVGIILVSTLTLTIALIFASVDRHVSGFESALDGSKRSYAQLREHHERLQGAFRAGGVGIWECDPATGLFYVDASLRDLYGTTQDGLPVPRDVWKARVHPDDVGDLDRRWNECLGSGDHYDNEYRIVRPD